MRKLIIIFYLLVVLTGLYSLEEGEDFPSFANHDLNKKYYFQKDFLGKWVILDFFATYCDPCKEELPELEEIAAAYAEQDFACLVIAIDKEGLDILKPFFEEHPATLPILVDKFGITAERYGVENLPTVFVVNPGGKIAMKLTGFSEENLSLIKALLEEHLGPMPAGDEEAAEDFPELPGNENNS